MLVMELMRNISWYELEEWKATQKTLSDRELMVNLKKGLRDESSGNLRVAELKAVGLRQ